MWLFKTRSRIDNTKRFIKSWIETNASDKVYFRLDDDDPNIQEYLGLSYPESFEIVIGPRVMLGKAMEEMFIKYPSESFYGLLADDLIPKTLNWDTIVSTEAKKNKIVAFNENLNQGEDINFEHMCVGGNIVRAVGWFGLPCTEHYYQDVVWRNLAKNRSDLFSYLEEVVVEHNHPIHNSNAQLDSTYNSSRKFRHTDREKYLEWHEESFSDVLNRLKTI